MAKSAKKVVAQEITFQGINSLPEDQRNMGVTAQDIFKFVQEQEAPDYTSVNQW